MSEKITSKDINFVIEQTAQQLGIKEDLVAKVLRNEWKEIRSGISEGKYKDLYLKNLGTFAIKTDQEKLNEHIRYLIRTYKKTKSMYEAYLRGEEVLNFKWKLEEDVVQKLRDSIYNFLTIRRKVKKLKKLKQNRRNMSMILIPLDKLESYTNKETTPSIDYVEYLTRVANRIKKMRPDHYEKFPEHEAMLFTELASAFDESVLSAMEERKEIPIESGIVLIYSELFKKDNCLETGFFVRV